MKISLRTRKVFNFGWSSFYSGTSDKTLIELSLTIEEPPLDYSEALVGHLEKRLTVSKHRSRHQDCRRTRLQRIRKSSR